PAAGGPRLGQDRLLLAGPAGGVRPYAADVHQPQGEADRGLHHGAVRMRGGEMERHHFETDLQALKNRLLNMGALVEERVHGAVQALMERNLAAADAIAHGDEEVNALQIEIDDRCLKLLALQQPMASDLRLITSAMKINADLERIGDQAVNVAEN